MRGSQELRRIARNAALGMVALAISACEPTTTADASRLQRLVELQQAVVARPSDAQAQHDLGNFLAHEIGDHKAALAVYQRAVDLAPQRGEWRIELARLAMEAADYDRARAELERALTTSSAGVPWRDEAEELLVECVRLRAERGQRAN